MNDLLPCPFCGGKSVMEPIKNGYKIKCKSCAIKYQQKVLRKSLEWLEAAMIKHWNTRVK